MANAVVPPVVAADGAPEPPPSRGIARVLHDLRPKVVTGGYPIVPLLVLFALNVLDQLDREAFNVLFPEIRDWFGADLGLALRLANLAGFLVVLSSVPIGYLADRAPRTKLVATGVVIWATCTLLQGLAPTILLLSFFRFGSGLGKAIEAPSQALLADYYPPQTRGMVFAFHGMGSPVGRFLAPLLVAALFGLTGLWQVPFLVFAIPSFVFAIIVFTKLHEPVRGAHERRALGADEETALEEENPPSWGESFRIAWNVRTLRRLWFGLPFIIGVLATYGALYSELLDKKFGVGPGGRGVIAAIAEPVAIVGLIIGGVYANRLIQTKPSRVMTYLGVTTLLAAVCIALTAMVPSSLLILVVVLNLVQAMLISVVAPSTAALVSLIVPPRARGLATSVGALWAAAGFVLGIFISPFADAWGVQGGLVAVAAVFAIGALVWTTASTGVEPDIRAAMASALASHDARKARESGTAKLLVCRDVDVSYGNVQVLFNVDFDVEEGEIVALLGTNGAGKSTLLRAISGLTSPSNGAIFFDAENITHLPAHEHVDRGVVLVNGGRGVFPMLTVGENLAIAGWSYRDEDEYLRDATERVLTMFPVLRQRQGEVAASLSGGEQQMLTLAQAFLSRPRLLMIDELSLGLAPAVVAQLLDVVRAIHAQGTTIVLVEQSVNVALTVADRAVFMEKGEVRFTGPTAELLERNDVLRSVFLRGASSSSAITSERAASRRPRLAPDVDAPPVLSVRGVRKRFGGVDAINGIDLDVGDGSIVGIIGPNGAGKTTLFDIISGFIEPDDGQIVLLGEEVTYLSPDGRAKLGLIRSFQDAALFGSLTVAENLAVALDRQVEARSATAQALQLPKVRRDQRRVAKRVDRLLELSNLGDYRNKFVRELSTGSRRLVDLAMVLAADPRVMLLDEPSSGVAQRETEELAPLLLRIRQETGCAMVLIEHDMPLVRGVSDEIVALDLGRNLARGTADEVLDDPRVVASYLGANEDVIRRSGDVDTQRTRRTGRS